MVRFLKERIKLFKTTEGGILIFLLLLSIVLSFISENFITEYNLAVIIRNISFITIVAVGQTLVLISGGIDLSVGAIAGFCGIMVAMFMVNFNIDPYLSVILITLLGTLIGFTSGFFITKVKLNPFIVTLAMGEIFYGMILVVTEGWAISDFPPEILFLGQGMIGPVPFPAIIMLGVAVIFAYILRNAPFGRKLYAIGGNVAASRLVGINVDRIKISVYAISGGLAGFAGILMACRFNSGQPNIGQNWVMPSVTAAILGGTSLSGGQGKIFGTVVGATLMGVIANAIVLLNISAYWERVIIGAIVLLAVVLDILRMNTRLKG